MKKLNSKEIVQKAWENKFVIPAYNIAYLPMMEPIIRAIKECNSFGLIQVARLETIKFKAKSYEDIKEEYEKWKNDKFTRLHLDHVPVIDEDEKKVDYINDIKKCLDLGYESVMVDGSRLNLKENIIATKKITELAEKYNVPVEGELGAVIGHEEGPLPEYEEMFRTNKGFTDPEEAKKFVKETKVSWLSVAIGNIHGAIAKDKKNIKKITARLNIEQLKNIKKNTNIPLVLHGGSGIEKTYIKEAIKNGIAKINVATNIRQPYEKGLEISVEKAKEMAYEATVNVIKNELEIENIADKLQKK